MSQTMREAIEAAYEDDQEGEEAAPVVEAIAPEGAPVEEETPAPAEEETAPIKAPVAAPEETPVVEKETPKPEESPPDEVVSIKAPAGWKGGAKQEWDKVPAAAQTEIIRRERETDRVLQESAGSRKFSKEFEQTIAPFRTFIEADKATPLQAVQNLMQTAAGLRVGTAQQKAAIVTDIIKNFGIDIGTLDSMLAGEEPSTTPEHDQMAQLLDQRLKPMTEFMQTFQQARDQSTQNAQQSVASEIDTFAADPKNVYFEDVREQMAVLLEVSAKQNRELTLEQAYGMAVSMDPALKAQLPPPVTPPAATGGRDSLARKKLAASSVPGSTQAPQTTAAPDTMRDQIAAAWEAAGG